MNRVRRMIARSSVTFLLAACVQVVSALTILIMMWQHQSASWNTFWDYLVMVPVWIVIGLVRGKHNAALSETASE